MIGSATITNGLHIEKEKTGDDVEWKRKDSVWEVQSA